MDYICTECKDILENGELAAKEICPKCKAINSFVSIMPDNISHVEELNELEYLFLLGKGIRLKGLNLIKLNRFFLNRA